MHLRTTHGRPSDITFQHLHVLNTPLKYFLNFQPIRDDVSLPSAFNMRARPNLRLVRFPCGMSSLERAKEAKAN